MPACPMSSPHLGFRNACLILMPSTLGLGTPHVMMGYGYKDMSCFFCELELSERDWHYVMAQFYCGQLILVLCSIQYCFLVVKPFDLILEVLGSTLVLV